MPSLDATPKSPSANAYLTAVEATAYFNSQRLYSALWTAASSLDKDRVIQWATLLLDVCMDWEGSIRTLEQALRWPRSGVLDADDRNVDYDLIPIPIKNATAELALSLLARDRTAEPTLLGQGFVRAKVGPIEVDLNRNVTPSMVDLIPDHILTMLSEYGQLKASATHGSMAIPLERR